MKPIDFPQRTFTLTKPMSMTGEECGSLPAYRGENEIISCWRPTWRERLSILIHGRVWLRVMGTAHPPVLLEATRTVFAVEPPSP